MKIKGTYRAPNAKLGKRYGDPIEFTPEEKVPLAVIDAMKALAPKGELRIVNSPLDVTLDPGAFQYAPMSLEKKSGFASNSYQAKGKVKFHRMVIEGDRLFPAQTKSFNIQFEDSLDEWGQPDLSVKSFEFL